MILYKIKPLYENINILKDSIDPKYRLIYYCGKVEQILQELLDTSETANKITLEYKYSELLEHCFKILKHEKEDLDKMYSESRDYTLTSTNVYSLMEYSIRKFDKPQLRIYDRQFKSILKNIITQIVESEHFENILKHVRWI